MCVPILKTHKSYKYLQFINSPWIFESSYVANIARPGLLLVRFETTLCYEKNLKIRKFQDEINFS
jgi:hypothetical protein